jgi:hypothetical protein
VGDHRRPDPPEQRHRDAEGHPHAGEHEHEPDVAHAANGVDVGGAEQQPLQ